MNQQKNIIYPGKESPLFKNPKVIVGIVKGMYLVSYSAQSKSIKKVLEF